jgi:peptidyl-prolyl cis-trans isomerase D
MLEFMRRRARSTAIKVLFLIIIFVFIFWGVESFVQGNRLNVIATVNDQLISLQEFQRAYQNVKSEYRERYKDQFAPELLQQLNVKQQTLDQLIVVKLMAAEARRVGLTVADEEVREAIAAMPPFQAYGGFSPDRYQRVLRFLRMTPSEFEAEQRSRLLIKKFEELIRAAVHVTEAEVQDLFRFTQEKVNLTFVKIVSADLLDKVTVDHQAMEEFYNTRRESFRQLERVRFAYVAYPAAHFAPEVEVSAQEVNDFYGQYQDERFTVPERVHARHILFAVPSDASAEEKDTIRATASEVLARVQAGEDFATLAKTYSEDTATAPDGGDLGFFPRGRMVQPFEEAAFRLSPGEVSELVETPFGFHIIKVEAKESKRVRPLTEVEEEIRQELTNERARERAREQAHTDRAKVQAGASLGEVAQATGLTVVDTPLVGRDETIPNLGRQPQLIEAAFALAPQQVSEPVAVEDTWYLVLPHEKVPSIIPEFSSIAEAVERRYKGEQAEQLAKEKAEALLARVQETKDLVAVAEQEQLTVEETDPFTRQGSYIPKMGSLPDLKKAAFRLTSDAPVVSQVYVWGGNAFVAALKDQIPPNPEDFEQQKEMIRSGLLQYKQDAAVTEFLESLKKRATIEYNQEALLNVS